MATRRSIRLPAVIVTVAILLTSTEWSPALKASNSDTRARDRIEAALAALGGLERLESLNHWYVEGRGRENLSAELQGEAPDRPTWRPHEERVAVDRTSLSVAWERRTPRNDQSLRWRRMVFRSDGFGFVDWNGPRAALRPTGTAEPRRRALARRIPHLLVLEAATRSTDVRCLDERSVDGASVDRIAVILPDAGEIVLTVGRHPALLRAAEYTTHLPGRGDVTVVWQWYGWRPDAQLGAVPAGHRIRIAGSVFQEVDYSEYGNGSLASTSLLAIPARLLDSPAPMTTSSVRPLPGESRLPSTGEVAPGVHVAEVGGFFVMFVEFRDFVVAVEAPESHPGFESIPAERVATSVTDAFLDVIRTKKVPGKPIRYAVISHHHSDHLGGVRRMVAAGATVLVAPSHASAAKTALSARHTVSADGLAARRRPRPFETVARRRVITDGERTMEILNVGNNPHTGESLCVWLPKERILFQGDLFYYDEGAPFPPSGRETMNQFFARWLAERAIRPLAVYGVHGRGAAGPERLTESVRPDDASKRRRTRL